MTTVKRYARASSLMAALEAKRAEPEAAYLAGGTLLLAGDGRDRPESVIDLGLALPKGIQVERDRADGSLADTSYALGAGATFQELAESSALPHFFVEALLTMANRNTRNRATIGGNLAADKSCSSLVPILLVLGTELEVLSPFAAPSGAALSPDRPERLSLEAWLRDRENPASPRRADIVLNIQFSLGAHRHAAYRRWNRVSCDLSVLGAAVAFEMESDLVKNLRIALGGLGPRARLFPELASLFEGTELPTREAVEAATAPLLHPIDDLRASAAFKRLRASQLLAEALLDAASDRSEGDRA
jgi:CO/xanthine dehydrogenase FAD-binding subunit